MKTSPAVAPATPVIPPTTSAAAPPQAPTAPPSSAIPATGDQAPKNIGPSGSGRKDESCSGNFWAAAEKDKGKGEAEVTSADRAEAPADDALVLTHEADDPSDCHATPKAYATRFFHKLTEAQKWELEQNLLNQMINNAWSKSDAQSYEIEQYKQKTCKFLDDLLSKCMVR
jgi:hypothetical protein